MNSIASRLPSLIKSASDCSILSLFPLTALGRALSRSQLDTPPDPTLWDLGRVWATAWSLAPLPHLIVPLTCLAPFAPLGS